MHAYFRITPIPKRGSLGRFTCSSIRIFSQADTPAVEVRGLHSFLRFLFRSGFIDWKGDNLPGNGLWRGEFCMSFKDLVLISWTKEKDPLVWARNLWINDLINHFQGFLNIIYSRGNVFSTDMSSTRHSTMILFFIASSCSRIPHVIEHMRSVWLISLFSMYYISFDIYLSVINKILLLDLSSLSLNHRGLRDVIHRMNGRLKTNFSLTEHLNSTLFFMAL